MALTAEKLTTGLRIQFPTTQHSWTDAEGTRRNADEHGYTLPYLVVVDPYADQDGDVEVAFDWEEDKPILHCNLVNLQDMNLYED